MIRVTKTVTGRIGPGPISVPGVKVGDNIAAAIDITSPVTNHSSFFALWVVVHGELYQAADFDQTGVTLLVILERELVV